MKSAAWPLYGAALGGAGIALYISAIQFLPIGLGALAVVLFWASVSRLVREDVLFGAPRRGPALIQNAAGVSMAILWVAVFLHEGVTRVGILRMTAAAIAAQTISRGGVVVMAWVSRPAARGLELTARMRSGGAFTAGGIGLLAALIYGVRIGAGLAIGTYLLLRTARGWFYHRHQGVDGDDIAYARILVESFILLLAAFAR